MNRGERFRSTAIWSSLVLAGYGVVVWVMMPKRVDATQFFEGGARSGAAKNDRARAARRLRGHIAHGPLAQPRDPARDRKPRKRPGTRAEHIALDRRNLVASIVAFRQTQPPRQTRRVIEDGAIDLRLGQTHAPR